MLSKEQESEFDEIKDKMKIIQKERTKVNNEEYTLNERYLKLLQEKCRENIGRCFKKMKNGKVISYCRIINTDEITYEMHRGSSFNEFQYPAMWFKYPYDNSLIPFYEKDLFSGAWGIGHDHTSKLNGISYVEISNDEFLGKFEEVNNLWISKIYLNTL